MLRKPHWSVLSLMIIATWASQSCSGLDSGCTTIGCPWTAQITADLPVGFDQLRGTTLSVTACRNDLCQSGTFAVSDPIADGIGLGVKFPDAGNTPPASASVHGGPGGSLWLEVDWRPDDSADLKPGDKYRVTVTGAAGASILALDETAPAYQASQPNGASCGPTCRSVVIDRRAPRPDR
jgi:hypothetical protein